MFSTPVRHVFDGRTGMLVGNLADTLGVLAVVFGLAGSLAMGTLSVRSGLSSVYGTPESVTTSIFILIALYVCYMLSATTGVDKGIKILSNLNMVLAIRSEEHTSELQSLMRISYAVFCLKKKTNTITQIITD